MYGGPSGAGNHTSSHARGLELSSGEFAGFPQLNWREEDSTVRSYILHLGAVSKGYSRFFVGRNDTGLPGGGHTGLAAGKRCGMLAAVGSSSLPRSQFLEGNYL